ERITSNRLPKVQAEERSLPQRPGRGRLSLFGVVAPDWPDCLLLSAYASMPGYCQERFASRASPNTSRRLTTDPACPTLAQFPGRTTTRIERRPMNYSTIMTLAGNRITYFLLIGVGGLLGSLF